MEFIKTFRSKLIVCVIGSSAVFFLLLFTTQSVHQSFRQADFSEQETTIKRGCGKDSLSNRFFSKYNCSGGIIREDSEGEILGGATGKTEKIEGPSRGKVKTAESASFFETTKEAARSKSSDWLWAGLLLAGVFMFFIYHHFNQRRLRNRPISETSVIHNRTAFPRPFSIHPTSTPKMLVPPQESVRLLLFDFNQQLSKPLQRRRHESLTEWTQRIELSTSLAPYLITRYATETDCQRVDPNALRHFKQDLTTYLRHQSSHH
ncbi:hypothetical protein [Exiguobacterium sp. s192]|uniref:hypothetical protein n=1 Tax=Exiguobacterium sp. s192 TaxID=2751206 RepID=UPI001BE71954|nr:hypothetical protein [Exiguobacterium sp. s192]